MSTALTEMASHVNQVHGVHLFGDPVLPLIPWVEEVGLEIPKEQGFAPSWALGPCLINVG